MVEEEEAVAGSLTVEGRLAFCPHPPTFILSPFKLFSLSCINTIMK